MGSYEKEIKSIYIALDATGEVIRHAIDAKADLLLTHHPMLMHGLKKINDGDFYGRRVLELIKHDIAYYAYQLGHRGDGTVSSQDACVEGCTDHGENLCASGWT